MSGYGDNAEYGYLPYKGEYGLHYQALKKLSPVSFGGDFDATMQSEGSIFDSIYFQFLDIESGMFPYGNKFELFLQWLSLFSTSPIGTSPVNQVQQLVRSRGGLNKRYFEGLIEAIGYKIGTHGDVGDPHARIVDDDYPLWRVGISRVGIDPFYDDTSGASQWTMNIYGTNVFTDDHLQNIINEKIPAWVEVNFINE